MESCALGKSSEPKANAIDINHKDVKGRTGLHYTAMFGRDEDAKILLDKGAKVDALDKKNRSPLHIAAEEHGKNDCTKVMQVLFEYGANPNLKDENGKSPEELLSKYLSNIDAEFDKFQLAKVLMDKDAKVDAFVQ